MVTLGIVHCLGQRPGTVPGHLAAVPELLHPVPEAVEGDRTALAVVLDRARTTRTALMCAETVWWHCHRMLVADALVLRGATVTHLLEVGRRQRHRLTRGAGADPDGWLVYRDPDALPGL